MWFEKEKPECTWNNGTAYRYGWGGHENDNEIKGDGNSITTHFRLNDPRVGRWFTMDPVTHFSQGAYVSMGNDPVNMIDSWGAAAEKSGGSSKGRRGSTSGSTAPNGGGGWLSKAIDIAAQLFEGLLSAAEKLLGIQDNYDTLNDYYSDDPFNPIIIPDENIPAMALLGQGMNEFGNNHETEYILINAQKEVIIEGYLSVPFVAGITNLALSQGWIKSSFNSESDGYVGLALTPAGLLAGNLVRKGFIRIVGYAAHHIVPWSHKYKSAQLAREILEGFGIDINDASNGVFLKASSKIIGETANHSSVHTHRYMDEVLKGLEDAKNREEAEFILQQIGSELKTNTFPIK